MQENNLAACGCGGEVVIRPIGNAATKSRHAEVECQQCHIKIRIGAIRNSIDWCMERAAQAWNKAMSRPTPAITDGMVAVGAAAIVACCVNNNLSIEPMPDHIAHFLSHAALTAALPHAVDAAGFYNQAVEDCVTYVEEQKNKQIEAMDAARTECQTAEFPYQDYKTWQFANGRFNQCVVLLKHLRALKNPTATAPDAYEKCESCNGSGLALNISGEPDECRDCRGNTVVPAPDAAAIRKAALLEAVSLCESEIEYYSKPHGNLIPARPDAADACRQLANAFRALADKEV